MEHQIDYSQIPESRRIEFLFKLKGYSKEEFIKLTNEINERLNKRQIQHKSK